MIKTLLTIAAVLGCSLAAHAQNRTEYYAKFRDTILIVKTNHAQGMPISSYERQQIFSKDFLFHTASTGPLALFNKTLSLAQHSRDLLGEDATGRTVLFHAQDVQILNAFLLRVEQLGTQEYLKSAVGYWSGQRNQSKNPSRVIGKLINKRDKLGKTAVMVLIQHQKYAAATRLIERGADVSLSDKKGRTALHFAAQRASDTDIAAQKLVRLIVSKNPYLTVKKDNSGRTAAQWAKTPTNKKMYAFLAQLQKRTEISLKKERTLDFFFSKL